MTLHVLCSMDRLGVQIFQVRCSCIFIQFKRKMTTSPFRTSRISLLFISCNNNIRLTFFSIQCSFDNTIATYKTNFIPVTCTYNEKHDIL